MDTCVVKCLVDNNGKRPYPYALGYFKTKAEAWDWLRLIPYGKSGRYPFYWTDREGKRHRSYSVTRIRTEQ